MEQEMKEINFEKVYQENKIMLKELWDWHLRRDQKDIRKEEKQLRRQIINKYYDEIEELVKK